MILDLISTSQVGGVYHLHCCSKFLPVVFLDPSLGFLTYLADAARCAGGNRNVHKSSISLTSSFSLRNLPQRLLHSFQFQNVLIFCLLAN